MNKCEGRLLGHSCLSLPHQEGPHPTPPPLPDSIHHAEDPTEPMNKKRKILISNSCFHHRQHCSSSAGLMRFGSAPSSFLAKAVFDDDYPQPQIQPGSLETETLFVMEMKQEESEPPVPIPPSENCCPAVASPPIIYDPLSAGRVMNDLGSGIFCSNNQRQDSASLDTMYVESAGFAAPRYMGIFRGGKTTTDDMHIGSAAARLPPASTLMPQISGMGSFGVDHIGAGPVHRSQGSGSSFPYGTWDEAASSFFNEVERGNQDFSAGTSATPLAHHLSLPKSCTTDVAPEKLWLFDDSVIHCRVRAKRGFATHPRSIAERVRRTRISERIRKLQELFPNMDKQTNTADMLDVAIEYIKNLQNQIKALTDIREKCTCKQRQLSHPTA